MSTTTYFATFLSGTQKIIARELGKLHQTFILELHDGLVIFRSSERLEVLEKIRYFNNLFLLLALHKHHHDKSQHAILQEMLHSAARKGIAPNNIRQIIRNKKTFKIFSAIGNETVSVDRTLLRRVEQHIVRATGLRLYIPKPDLEFWFMARSEGFGLFGMRLTSLKKDNRAKKRGSLRTELAHILCLISNPKPDDVICDPFCGSGSIVIERARSFKFRAIYGFDEDRALIQELQAATRAMKNFYIRCQDAFHANIEDRTVSTIITDPPWGLYKNVGELDSFYRAMLKKFARMLSAGGTAVVLTGAKEIFEKTLGEKEVAGLFTVNEKYNILVSGKKAAIYKMQQIGRHDE